MKVLYLTDNKENYIHGNYYEDWLHAFKKRFPDLTLFGPGYPTSMDCIPDDIDLVVYGHSFMDVLMWKEKADLSGNKKFHGLDFKKYKRIPSILFSKNEYKNMKERIDFVKKLENCLLVVYSKETLHKYEKIYTNISWAPFGINRDKFNDKNNERTIDIGMRGNEHTDYIGSIRNDAANMITEHLGFMNLDVKLSKNGEDFLFGDAYIDWLNRSKFTANTRSAMEMNPKFAEVIGCGSILVCPVDSYEGLLIKDKHYVDVEDLIKVKNKGQFNDYYIEKKEMMKPYFEDFVKMYDYDNLLSQIIEDIR